LGLTTFGLGGGGVSSSSLSSGADPSNFSALVSISCDSTRAENADVASLPSNSLSSAVACFYFYSFSILFYSIAGSISGAPLAIKSEKAATAESSSRPPFFSAGRFLISYSMSLATYVGFYPDAIIYENANISSVVDNAISSAFSWAFVAAASKLIVAIDFIYIIY